VFALGVRRFIYGLTKKVLVANSVAIIADGVFSTPIEGLGFVSSWLGILAYTLQIYFDFSGYSDMAIGLGMMFGFRFPENFNFPYIARSIKDFWRRWHISLSTWFRDYLYIPLGGNRGGSWRVYRNLFLVFVLCGFWHGAEWTFVVWGVYHGAFLMLERWSVFDSLHARLPRPAKHIYAILIIMIGWVFFRSETLTYALGFIKAMTGMSGWDNAVYPVAQHLGVDGLLGVAVGVVFACPLFAYLADRVRRIKPSSELLRGGMELGENILLMVLLCFCAIALAGNVYNPFLYFRF
jgi:alginate O-acetyltransferase complex protein AlgI